MSSASATATVSTSEGILSSDGKNAKDIFCPRCPSKILCSGVATYQQSEFSLPPVKKKQDSSADDLGEKVSGTFMVDNMYAFENVGFSNTVGEVKYLICADCEVGPIGWHQIDTKKSYVAVSRVKQQ